MRASKLAIAAILLLIAGRLLAQTVIDIGERTAAEPGLSAEAQPQTQAPADAQESAPIQAENPPIPANSKEGRYSFSRVDNGFLRLDYSSGQVAFCRPQTVGWSCEAVPENRASLETEVARLKDEIVSLTKLKEDIARLQAEIISLKKEVAALKEPPPPRPPAGLSPAPGKDDVIIKLPTQEDIARARDFMQKTWRRLVEMVTAIQKDVMQKG